MAFFPCTAQCLRMENQTARLFKGFSGTHDNLRGSDRLMHSEKAALTQGQGAEQPGHHVVCSVMGLGSKGKVRISSLVLSENSSWELRCSSCGSQELSLMIPGAPSSPFSLPWAYILLYNTSSEGVWFIQQAQHPCQTQAWDCPLNMPFLCLLLKHMCGGGTWL